MYVRNICKKKYKSVLKISDIQIAVKFVKEKMKFLVVFLPLACVVFASLEEEREQWASFKNKHGKQYKNLQEEKFRFSVFQQNLLKIEEHNRQFEAGNATYTMGVNQFADLTKQEYLSMLKRSSAGRPNLETDSIYQRPPGLEVQDSIDWRQNGAVSRVKNQGDCGSCWAFSVTGTLESFNYLATNQMVTYSEQQLVDCSTASDGCGGGDEWPSLKYVQEYGIESDDNYPYTGTDGSCRYDQGAVALKTKGYIRLKSNNEGDLLSAVGSLGPISVALDATDLDFYSGGVITDGSCTKKYLDHAVLAVGYGKDSASGLDYWLIKNSWGEDWGEEGYFKIRRGVNECGIAGDSVYPVL